VIIIRPARRRDAPRIIALADATFGEGYESKKEIVENLGDYIVLYLDDALAGYASTAFYEPHEYETEEALAYIESVGVYPEFRGLSFGTILAGVCTANLIKEGADLIECVAAIWSDLEESRPPLAGPLERNNFHSVQYLSHYWKDDDPGKYKCRACGSNECKCDAMLYRRRINTDVGENSNGDV
jgi:ribosomal protein S18 acetylase RimI-like enzyme